MDCECGRGLLGNLPLGEVDVVPSYTIPLPMRVIARLLGIPGEEYATFRRWSEATVSVTTTATEDRAQHMHEMAEYFGRMAVARRAQGADELRQAAGAGCL